MDIMTDKFRISIFDEVSGGESFLEISAVGDTELADLVARANACFGHLLEKHGMTPTPEVVPAMTDTAGKDRLPGWIRADVKTPALEWDDGSRMVFVLIDTGETVEGLHDHSMRIGYYDGENWYADGEVVPGESAPDKRVTHWAPIPEYLANAEGEW